MGDPYERATAGRLAFKGGALASRSKSIDKKKKKKKKKKRNKHTGKPPAADGEASEFQPPLEEEPSTSTPAPSEGGGEIYTIDAAKRLKYDQLFPVEAKRFGYDPKTTLSSVEDALDDRVKKKADRYCK
ncbi:uncharacterized protein LOC127794508 [Diospyros lotus]|uniref:uncharacterized protein LOC127794508 n=1 Tax=Diospyros lotus TaxID=55363 RepID=UPI002253A276|nr:uncharacterized protein LOC127794508 [Diospyros lotus]XP_052181626.1 uncharacterized protein LOC127794508 [Diospyros lotus]